MACVQRFQLYKRLSVVSGLKKTFNRQVVEEKLFYPQASMSLTWAKSQARHISLMTTEYKFDDYDAEKKNFNLTVPEYFNFARDFIDAWAKAEQTGIRDASIPAFWWVDAATGKEIKWTFQDLSQQSKRIANALVNGCGLRSGDRLISILPKVPEWWAINTACIRANLVQSPGTILLRTKDIKHRLQLSEAKCIITIPELCAFVEKASEDIDGLVKIVVGEPNETPPGWRNFKDIVEKAGPDFECVNTKWDEPMSLFFTSGTTGSPKMAVHSHSSYGLGHTTTARYFLMCNPRTVVWNISDPGWAKCAWSSFFAPWIHGSCVFIHHSTGPFDPTETLKVLCDYPVNTLCLPPTVLRFMAKQYLPSFSFKALNHLVCGGEPVVLATYPITHFCTAPTGYRILTTQGLREYKFKTLNRCLTAGEPANPELIEMWRNGTGLDVYEGYGQTETTLICSRFPCIKYKPGSMGKASPGLDLAVVDHEGNKLPPGKEGSMAIRVKPNRPIGLFSGYLNDPERTAASFLGDYFLLGDRCFMDEDDYVYFVGRSDDVIISAGYRIGPFEIESALLEHPAVVESAVVSSPDELRGAVVKAFVILDKAYKGENKEKLTLDLQNHVKTVTAPYKYPRKIEFVEELPKTISGKIRRIELREKEWEQKASE